jgi:RimJ/RimL family protein N-acetyltransferase
MSVRRAGLEELSALEAVVAGARASEPDLGPRLLAATLRALLAEEDGEPVGAALLERGHHAAPEDVRVRVVVARRRAGHGAALLAAALADARARGVHKLAAECDPGDRAALALAARGGFAIEALLPGHRAGPDGRPADRFALGVVL